MHDWRYCVESNVKLGSYSFCAFYCMLVTHIAYFKSALFDQSDRILHVNVFDNDTRIISLV